MRRRAPVRKPLPQGRATELLNGGLEIHYS
jgi:hypothetical protein